jgi:hypothetical protein
MKCKDCGKTDYEAVHGGLVSLCPECWILRGQLIDAVTAGKIAIPEFQKIQRTIANSHGSGRGANAMRHALGLDAPII